VLKLREKNFENLLILPFNVFNKVNSKSIAKEFSFSYCPLFMIEINNLSSWILLILCFYLASGDNDQEPYQCAPSKRGFSKVEKDAILKAHNDYRQQILNGEIEMLPKAKSMKLLKWDEDLEKEAQRWAETCPSMVDPDRPPHPPPEWKIGTYGQNMAWNFATAEDAITAWFDEYIPYVEKGIMPLIYRGVNDPERILAGLNGHDTPISHFTAMVHANTDKIGCGFVEEACDNCKTYACNYRPSGNRIVNGIPEPAYEVDNGAKVIEEDPKKSDSKNIVNVKKRSRFRSGRRRVPNRPLDVITTEKTSMQTTQHPNNIISMEDLKTQRPEPPINVISMGDLIKQQIENSPIGITHDLFGNPINQIEKDEDTSVNVDKQSDENPIKRIYRSYLDKNYHANDYFYKPNGIHPKFETYLKDKELEYTINNSGNDKETRSHFPRKDDYNGQLEKEMNKNDGIDSTLNEINLL